MPLIKTVTHSNKMYHKYSLLSRCRHSKCVEECGKKRIMIWWWNVVWNTSQWIRFGRSKQSVPRYELQVAFGYLPVPLILNAATKNNHTNKKKVTMTVTKYRSIFQSISQQKQHQTLCAFAVSTLSPHCTYKVQTASLIMFSSGGKNYAGFL
jgi:hypothetical protein